jgi:predicted RNA-binding Zn-ribbon protein involved in translation (DUF1610 family)
VKCSNCGVSGHDHWTCPDPEPIDPPMGPLGEACPDCGAEIWLTQHKRAEDVDVATCIQECGYSEDWIS